MSRFGIIFLNGRRTCSSRIMVMSTFRNASYIPSKGGNDDVVTEKTDKTFKKLRAKTPIGKLDEMDIGRHPNQEKEPLKEWPNNTNPITGEIGGPRGLEPTRYGDWERKGRVTDF